MGAADVVDVAEVVVADGDIPVLVGDAADAGVVDDGSCVAVSESLPDNHPDTPSTIAPAPDTPGNQRRVTP